MSNHIYSLTKEQVIFLHLLSIALHKNGPFEDYSFLMGITSEQWQTIYSIAVAQGVLALVSEVFDSIPDKIKPPKSLIFQWTLNVEQIEKKYNHYVKTVEELCDIWNSCGIKPIALKGITYGQYYPEPSHRQCGDFDCYMFNDYERGNDVAEKAGAVVNRAWYKHSQIFYEGIMAENHRLLVTTRESKEKKMLNEELVKIMERGPFQEVLNTGVNSSSVEFGLKFQAYHSLSHFLSEGITLRNICDWYCYLTANQDNIDWSDFKDYCNRYNYTRFVEAITYICVTRLGLSITNNDIVMNSQYSDHVLYSIFNDNFKVFSSGKSAWHNRIKLVRNIFHSGWKYRQIAQQSSLGFLMRTVVGYLFKRN